METAETNFNDPDDDCLLYYIYYYMIDFDHDCTNCILL